MNVWVIQLSDYDADMVYHVASSRALAEGWILREVVPADWTHEVVRNDDESLVYVKKTLENGHEISKVWSAAEYGVDS